MFVASEEVVVPAAHRLALYGGDGENLHGHNWRVRATVRAARLDPNGMVVDFERLHEALVEVTAAFRENCLNEVPPFDALNPTAEHFAMIVCRALEERIGDERVRVESVQVWESPTAWARFTPPD